jgi:photosystem II stability/assembly factor-like uncharacterized protein
MRGPQTWSGTPSGRAWIALAAVCLGIAACDSAPARRSIAAPTYEAQVINPDLNAGLLVPGSNVLLVWGSDGSILRSEDGADWTHAVTATDADLARIAANSDGSVLIAVGANGTILRSGDAGRRWQTVQPELTRADLRALAYQPSSNTFIAAGSHGNILRSTDGGQTWTSVDSSLDVQFQALFVDPRTDAILLGGDEGLVGVSTDAGVSFRLLTIPMPEPKTPFTAFYRHDRLLLATSALGRFITSADDAQSWDLLQANTKAFFTDTAFDPKHDALVMTGHNGDVLVSIDAGRNWHTSEISIDGHKNYLSSVRFDERSGALIAVGEGGTIARSSDGGTTWVKASGDVSKGLRGMIADSRGRLIAFGAGGMLVSSTDSGTHWIVAQDALDFYLREIARVSRSDVLVATSSLGDIIRSTDGGKSWQAIAIDFPNLNTPPDLRALVENSAGALIAAGPPAAILRANGDASRWTVAHWTGIEKERAFPWMLADRKRNLLVAVEARGEMQVSRDAGTTWVPSVAPKPDNEFAFWQGAVLESRGVLLIAGKSGIAARSTDARSWAAVETHTKKDLYGSFADESSGLMFLMGQDGTLLRSTDLGINWSAMPSDSTQELRRMMRDPRSHALICFGGHGAIVRSGDDGLTWQKIASGTDGALRKGMIEPRTGNLMLIGSQGTLLRSNDGGRSWQSLSTHTAHHFNSMVFDTRGDLVLAGERIVRLVPH